MGHEIHVDKEAGRLDLRTSGSVSTDEAEQIAAKAERLCREHSLRSALIELEHVDIDVDDLAFYKLARRWAELARGRVRTAFVKGRFPQLEGYVSEVIQQHGVSLALFETRADAVLWLSRKMTPTGPLDGA